jgi:hypothetical protein
MVQVTSQRNQRNYNKSSHRRYTYKIGDWILIANKVCRKQRTPKFEAKFIGPYEIVRIKDDELYEITHVDTNTSMVVHYNRMKPYRMRISKDDYKAQSILKHHKTAKVVKENKTFQNLTNLIFAIPMTTESNTRNTNSNHSIQQPIEPLIQVVEETMEAIEAIQENRTEVAQLASSCIEDCTEDRRAVTQPSNDQIEHNLENNNVSNEAPLMSKYGRPYTKTKSWKDKGLEKVYKK